MCKSRISRLSSHFILFRLKFYQLSQTLLYSCFAQRCSTNFRFQLIDSRRMLNLILTWMFKVFDFDKLSFVTSFSKIWLFASELSAMFRTILFRTSSSTWTSLLIIFNFFIASMLRARRYVSSIGGTRENARQPRFSSIDCSNRLG